MTKIKPRLSYYPKGLLDSFTWLGNEVGKAVNDLSTAKRINEVKVQGIIKILYILSNESRNYHTLYYKSGIRFKQSFHNYSNWLQARGFITKDPRSNETVYSITPKGKTFMEMLK